MDQETRGIEDCTIIWPIRLLGGKWKPIIIYFIRNDINRFGKLEKHIVGINKQMLAKQLRELEKDGVISRKIFPEIPPRVEYSFTPLGESLFPIIDAMTEWTIKYKKPQADTK